MANRHMKRRKKNKGISWVAFVVCLVAVAMFFRIISLYKQNAEYAEWEKQLSQQIESEIKRQEDLEQYEAYVQTDEFIEKIARTKLGLVYSNEIIFKEKH